MAKDTLFNKFISADNFASAYRRVAAKKAVGGIDGISVESYRKNLYKNLERLRQQIRTGSYLPYPVKTAYIPKFNEENEWRELGLPVIADKIVQAALLQVVEPIVERIFLDTSYGYRRDKGHYKAIRRIEHNLLNQKMTWSVRRDIDNFFDTINHDKLLSAFSDIVKGDTVLVELIAVWLRMGLVDKSGRWRDVEAGVRQGHIISPLLANLYLHPLDMFVSHCNAGWVRYADDYLIQCKTRNDAERFDSEVITFLKKELSLYVNNDEHPIRNIEEGFTFLGISFQKDKREIAEGKMEKIKKKISWLLSDKNSETEASVIKQLSEKIEGIKRYYGFLNPVEQFAQIDLFIEKAFTDFAHKKISKRQWAEAPSEGMEYPLLNDNGDPNAGFKKIKELWKRASKHIEPAQQIETVKKEAEKKVSKRRRRYHREAAQQGDIFVLSPGHFIGRRSERIIVRKDKQIVLDMPALRLTGLTLCTRGTALSGDVITLCVEKEIAIHFTDELGRIIAVLRPPGGPSGDLSVAQIRERDSEAGLALAKMFVIGKVKNQFALLKYYHKYPANRENGFGEIFRARRDLMERLIEKMKALHSNGDPNTFRQQLMGLEGAFANHYWEHIKRLFNNGIVFEGRNREGAKDMVNSALNYGYGVLYSRIFNAIVKAGLNPMISFFHSLQKGKPALVYDLIEEFRAMAVDRAVFTLLNRSEKIGLDEDGMLSAESRKKVARAVIRRLSGEVIFAGRRITLEELINLQAENVKRHIFKNISYRPFLSKW